MTSSLWDRLQARRLPEEPVAIPVDPVAHRAAERQVEVDTRTLQLALAQGVDDLTIFRERLAAAQAALDALPVETFQLRCLPPEQWEELISEHPPTEAQRKQGWQWDTETFRPALLAASVMVPEGEKGLTELDWRQLAAHGLLAAGELELIYGTAVALNSRQPQVSTGKG